MINEFLEFCTSNYSRAKKCRDCKNECPDTGDCEKCLEYIHYGKRENGYNCQNIFYFYGCKYTYKYASEIWYLLVRYRNLKRLDELNILSLGCGSCPDFIGIDTLLKESKSKKTIKYYGVEINKDWNSIHSWIRKNSSNPFEIKYIDVFEFLKNTDSFFKNNSSNIVIISYLISELLRSKSNISNFINLLINNILSKLPKDSYLIINDFNRGLTDVDPRSHYGTIGNLAKSIPNVNVYSYHYSHNLSSYYRFYNQHPNNNILFQLNPKITKFNPWQFCSSAQLIIEKL